MQTVLDSILFKGIEVQDASFVLSKFVERKVAKYSVLFYQGEPGYEMYVIKSGIFKIFREEDRKEIILGHQLAGETIGELEVIHYDNHRLASVAALENAIVWTIRKPELEELMRCYPEIWRKMFYVMSERLTQADRKIEYLAFLDSGIRAANLLLDLNSNFGEMQEDGSSLINWRVTQQHFANMIGISRESAARALLDLQNESVIVIRDRLFVILDLNELVQRTGVNTASNNSREWHSHAQYGSAIN